MTLGLGGIDSIVSIGVGVGDMVVDTPQDIGKTETFFHVTGQVLQENVWFFSDLFLKGCAFPVAHLFDLAVGLPQ